jgi:hypothetical protein
MRMRAAYDDDDAAVSRLRSAAQMASDHGSTALLRRCEHDLAERGAAQPLLLSRGGVLRQRRRSSAAAAFFGGRTRTGSRERCANAAGSSVGTS